MNATSHRHTVDNPETADQSPIQRVTSELARADFLNERIEVSPPPDRTLNVPKQGAGDLPKQDAGSGRS